LRFQLEVKRGALAETGLFELNLHSVRHLGQLVEWDLNMDIILDPQPANSVANIKKVVFSVSRAAPIHM